MVSVVAHWGGRCPQKENQWELCRYIEQLAKVSHILYEEKPEIKRFDGKIEGRILLSPNLVEVASLLQYGVRMEEREEETDLDLATGEYKRELIKWPVLDEAHLYGIEFHLYDPRGQFYEDRMSFVFLSHEAPALNGLLLAVEDHEECSYYSSETIKEADWYLTSPRIHLRYYLEDWFDYLMGWTKYFFIPDLHFWRWRDGSDYCSNLKEQLDSLLLEAGDKSLLRDIVFEDIVERFKFEVIEWSQWNDENFKRIINIMSEHNLTPSLEDIEELTTPPPKRDKTAKIKRIYKKLNNEIKKIVTKYRKAGIPVDDNGRIDMDAFRDVYPPEKIERDKKLIERLKEIEYQELPNIDKLRAKIRLKLGGNK